jgi:hypothetical protein
MKLHVLNCDDVESTEFPNNSTPYVIKDKTINPYLFGSIYDYNNTYYNNFSILRINSIPTGIVTNLSQSNIISDDFIFYNDLSEINDLTQLNVLQSYNIQSLLNYNNDVNINLNYGFSFFRN